MHYEDNPTFNWSLLQPKHESTETCHEEVYDKKWLFGKLSLLERLLNWSCSHKSKGLLMNLKNSYICRPLFRKGSYFSQPVNGFA